MQSRLRERDTSDWLRVLLLNGVPAGPVNDIAEVLTNEYAVERRLVRSILNSDDIPVPTVSNPVEFSDTPVRYERSPPALGEHTDEVLQEWLGYSDAKIRSLRQDGVI
jgi:crotonobetainyl-CoA:carnitine CoA-transferase CaiB-like acyl-CoA transferase